MTKELNDYYIIRALKKIYYYIFSIFVTAEYLLWNILSRKKKIQRIFATTGNISLINSLAIIKETGDFDKYEDTLIIDTGKGGREFIKKQLEIAELHNFKKNIVQTRINVAVQAVLNNHFKADEIYLLNHPFFIKKMTSLFPFAKIILIDEGAASLINYDSDKIKNLVKFKTHKYLDKIDFLGLNPNSNILFEPINIGNFKEIAQTLAEKYPINYENNSNDKYVLYCGIYWEVTGLDRQTFIDVQSEMLNSLLNVGYKILYKPHPRDNEFFGYDKRDDVQFIDSKFPIELYNLDVVAIVSISSTTSITPAHYWNIPCFSNVLPQAINNEDKASTKLNIVRHLVSEYSPNYKLLLDIDVKNQTKQKVKEQIAEIYGNYLKDKPLLSQNKLLSKYVRTLNV